MGKIESTKKFTLWLNIILVVLFIGVLSFVTVKYAPSITKLVSTPEKLKDILLSYGYKSAFVFVLLQVLQVVIAVIPGEVIQVAGGYVYGTFFGSLLSVSGILIGSIIAFFTVRLLGYSLVRIFVPQKQIEKFDFLMNNPKSEIAMFILFLLPGLPKDILTYIAGLTPVKPLRFFIIVMVARLPGLIVSSYIGTNIQEKNYLSVIIISTIAFVLFAAGLLLKDKVIDRVHHILHKGRES